MFQPRNSTQVNYVVYMRAHMRKKVDTQVWSTKMPRELEKRLFPRKLLVGATFMELNVDATVKFLVPIANKS